MLIETIMLTETVERCSKEHEELQEKIEKLAKFTESTTCKGLPDIERDLLRAQLMAMVSYSSILRIRYNILEQKLALNGLPPVIKKNS